MIHSQICSAFSALIWGRENGRMKEIRKEEFMLFSIWLEKKLARSRHPSLCRSSPGGQGPGDQLDLRQHRSLNWEEPSYLNTTSKVCHIQIGIHAWNIYFIYQIYLLECGARLKQRKNVYTKDPFNPLPLRQYPALQWMNVITSMFFTSAISKK